MSFHPQGELMLQKYTLARLLCLLGFGLAVVSVPAMAGDAAAGKAKAGVCAGCHGVDGNGGADPSWPRLAGQHENYLIAQLEAFKAGKRKDPLMAPIAASLSKKDMENLAAYFSSLSVKAGAAKSKPLADKGERIYRGGNAKTGVSACMSCHGPSGHGIAPRYPKVSSQTSAYTEKQLLAFRSGKRASEAQVMNLIAQRMTDAEIQAVSEYMAGLH
jgi:cytochrome c553